MIQRFVPILIAVILVFSVVTLASARGAPQKTDAVQATAIADIPVVIAPTMPGYDVIQNITTEPRDLFIAQSIDVTSTASRRLSPTGYWRSNHAMSTSQTSRSGTMLRLKR